MRAVCRAISFGQDRLAPFLCVSVYWFGDSLGGPDSLQARQPGWLLVGEIASAHHGAVRLKEMKLHPGLELGVQKSSGLSKGTCICI